MRVIGDIRVFLRAGNKISNYLLRDLWDSWVRMSHGEFFDATEISSAVPFISFNNEV